MSRSQTKRPRDAARLASRHNAAAPAPAINAPADAPAHNQNARHPDPLITTGTDNSADPLVPIGAGFDTSRYGHYAAFLRADLQPAAADLMLVESALGYQQLRQRLDAIAAKHAGHVHFHMRIDVAGCYADNLLAFLQALPYSKTISCGDPERNKNYRVAIFGSKKSDPVEAHACARFAVTENPKPTPMLTPAMRTLGQIASRLESQARQNTRVLNQLHNLLARTFPELALLVKDLGTGWVLTVLERYPSAAQLAKARPSALAKIPYLPRELIPVLVEQAHASVASLTGPAIQTLVRDLAGQVKDAHIRQKSMQKLLVEAYRQLPANYLDTIPGIGPVTAAILTAKIVDPHRFVLPTKLTGLFGIFPVEAASGIDRDGNARLPIRMIMSKRGNDLVRRYLWMAALSAAQHNPAVRPLYQRVRAKHPDQPSIAIGHVMAKLLRIALAVWKTGKPFDPEHYPWEKPAHLQPQADAQPEGQAQLGQAQPTMDQPPKQNQQAAGHKNPARPERSVVTAACGPSSVPEPVAAGNGASRAQSARGAGSASDMPMSPSATRDTHRAQPATGPWLDFTHVKSQLPIQRVLEHLKLFAELRGRGHQWRGSCPVHGQGKGRTFSVHLEQNVFQCFAAKCAIKGDVIDLWAAVKRLNLRDAALDLVTFFNLEPAPATEKRHG
jgi:transposase